MFVASSGAAAHIVLVLTRATDSVVKNPKINKFARSLGLLFFIIRSMHEVMHLTRITYCLHFNGFLGIGGRER
jgi:hypothetical protein